MEKTNIGLDVKFVLRWRINYKDGSSKFGLWSDPGTCPTVKASNAPKENILEAIIEGKEVLNDSIWSLVICPGMAFKSFRWIATTSIPSININGSATLSAQINGMTIVTNKKKISALVDGTIRVEKL